MGGSAHMFERRDVNQWDLEQFEKCINENVRKGVKHWNRQPKEAGKPHPWKSSKLGWKGIQQPELVKDVHSRGIGI